MCFRRATVGLRSTTHLYKPKTHMPIPTMLSPTLNLNSAARTSNVRYVVDGYVDEIYEENTCYMNRVFSCHITTRDPMHRSEVFIDLQEGFLFDSITANTPDDRLSEILKAVDACKKPSSPRLPGWFYPRR
jgi:hypothetical protein